MILTSHSNIIQNIITFIIVSLQSLCHDMNNGTTELYYPEQGTNAVATSSESGRLPIM
jgi:hypothetical protein